MSNKGQLIGRMAAKYGVDANKLFDILKATAFKLPQKKGQKLEVVTNEQMAALLIVADQYDLNPFVREIYAFPDKKGGIIPIVPIDGWVKIITRNTEMDGIECLESPEWIQVPGLEKKCPAWIETHIYRRNWNRPVKIREYMEECYKPPYEGQTDSGKVYTIPGPWQTHTIRMLRHKSIMQCGRVAFGLSGIKDEEEAQEIITANTQAQKIAFDIDIQPERPAIAWQDRIDEMSSFKEWKNSVESLQEFVAQTAKIHNISLPDLVTQIAEHEDDFWAAAEKWCQAFDRKTNNQTTEESSTVATSPQHPTNKPAPGAEGRTHPDRDAPAPSPTDGQNPRQVGMFDEGPTQWEKPQTIEDMWASLEEIYPDVYDQLDQAGYNPVSVAEHWLNLGLYRLPDELKKALAMALGQPDEYKAHLNQIGIKYSEQQ